MVKHEVNGVEHVYYTIGEAEDVGLRWKPWRACQIGDWARTDDDMVVEVLTRGGTRSSYDWLRIATGTFVTSPGVRMTTEVRENRTSFGGKYPQWKDPNRKLTKRERLFTEVYTRTWDQKLAYAMASGRDKNERGVGERAAVYVARANVQEAVKDRIRELAARQGVDEDYVIGGFKELFEEGVNETTRARALENLAKILQMLDSKHEKAVVMLGAGITEAEIKEIDAEIDLNLIEGAEVADSTASSHQPDDSADGREPEALSDESADGQVDSVYGESPVPESGETQDS